MSVKWVTVFANAHCQWRGGGQPEAKWKEMFPGRGGSLFKSCWNLSFQSSFYSLLLQRINELGVLSLAAISKIESTWKTMYWWQYRPRLVVMQFNKPRTTWNIRAIKFASQISKHAGPTQVIYLPMALIPAIYKTEMIISISARYSVDWQAGDISCCCREHGYLQAIWTTKRWESLKNSLFSVFQI